MELPENYVKITNIRETIFYVRNLRRGKGGTLLNVGLIFFLREHYEIEDILINVFF